MTDELSVIPLGTVSPYPKDEHNCSGFLIQNGNQKILLDCGAGVFKKLKFPNDFDNLIIIISHFHGDHYSDLISIVSAYMQYQRCKKLNDKLKIFIPEKELYSNYIYDYLMSFDKKYLEFITYNDKTKFNHGNMAISFLLNIHPIKTYSTKIKCNNRIIVYSSDTGHEFDHLDLFAEKADLFICEATFLNNQKTENYHLSAFDAGMVAMAADVKELMLTHFNPEIDKQKYVLEAQKMFENTIAAEEDKKLVLK